MSPPRTSVVIASRGRPSHLRMCLQSLSLQDHQDFEVVLVADREGLAQSPSLPIKRIAFDAPNISAARNLGLSQAAGEVIAFIDDDAIAEPTWLSRLTTPFSEPAVIAATGWTREGDGFRWQTRSQLMTTSGRAEDIELPESGIYLRAASDGKAVSTIGTNCAFRSTALRRIGGFDPAFAFHLDELDVNMRLSRTFPGTLTAIVPQAQVIHARAQSTRRSRSGVSRDLTAQGRSLALFQRRYSDTPVRPGLDEVRQRLLRNMVDGALDPLHIPAVLGSFRRGAEQGSQMSMPEAPAPRCDDPDPFLPFLSTSCNQNDSIILAGWYWQAKTLRDKAQQQVRFNRVVTIILFTPTFLPHRVRLTKGGWFEQTGGVWGKSDPDDPPAMMSRFRDRCDLEISRAKRRRIR